MTAVVTVNDLLDGHVALDIECLDRIYLNGWCRLASIVSHLNGQYERRRRSRSSLSRPGRFGREQGSRRLSIKPLTYRDGSGRPAWNSRHPD
jgi:hypothetical protein